MASPQITFRLNMGLAEHIRPRTPHDENMTGITKRDLRRYYRLIDTITLPEFTDEEWQLLIDVHDRSVNISLFDDSRLVRAARQYRQEPLLDKLRHLSYPERLKLADHLEQLDIIWTNEQKGA